MPELRFVVRAMLFAAIAGLVIMPIALSQQGTTQPNLAPVADTKLLMEGLAHPNFRGLDRMLKKEPTSVKTWTFGRGQALLIAETGNLLLLRPPKGDGRAIWNDRAAKLRQSATELARSIAKQDYLKSRILLVQVANRCNSCHNSFRIRKEIVPFAK